MEKRFHHIPKNIQLLFYKEKSVLSIGSHIIGADLIITGNVRTNLIRKSFFKIVKKHNALHYKFSIGDKGIQKEKLREPEFQLAVFNCQNSSINDIREQILNNASMNILPEKGQVIAAKLYKIGNKKFVMAISATHLVSDAKSMEIIINDFLTELRQCYDKYDHINYDTKIQTNVLSKNAYQLNHVENCEFFETIDAPHIRNLKQLCRQQNTSLFSLLMAGLTTLSEIKTDMIGVLFSHRTEENRNDVGCFVQAFPVYLSDKQSIHQSAKEIKSQVSKIHKALGKKEELPAPPHFRVMFSMVKNPDTHLPAPDGIKVTYLRRLHTMPECDLHIYAYQYKDKLELVFNYNPELENPEKIKLLLRQYTEKILEFSKAPTLSNIPCSKHSLSLSTVKFHHVGFAVWEMDIGLRRIQSLSGVFPSDQTIEDDTLGVELSIMDTEYAGRFELIAPLRKDAPCVGFLERHGEGPYHCCWQISSIQAVLDNLEQREIRYTLIEKDGESKLLPQNHIHFLIVHGIGLVEFIEKQKATSNDHNSKMNISEKNCMPMSIEIISNNFGNAVKFLHMLNYKPEDPVRGIWKDSERLSIFKIHDKQSESESRISRVVTPEFLNMEEPVANAQKSLSENWYKRVCI